MAKIFFLLTFILGLQAFAVKADVNCSEGGCFIGGWTVEGRHGQILTEVQCVEQSCASKGWTNYYPNGSTDVVCRGGECFRNGWIETGYNGRLLASAVCSKSHHHDQSGVEASAANCLENGWTIYMQNNSTYEVRCLKGGCEFVGWESFINGVFEGRSLCKANGCFVEGWQFN